MPADWCIQGGRQIADGIGGRVFLATRSDGSQVIVKAPSDLAIRDGEPPRGADFLAWRDGTGSVRLLGRHGELTLLEYLDGPTLTHVLETRSDDAATGIAADVLLALHAPGVVPFPASLQPLQEYFQSLFVRAAADRNAGRDTQYVAAAAVAERLLASQKDVRPLHGDIHHDNIMQGARGWLAIDPKGLIGDPAFDAANLFYNPIDNPLRNDPSRIASMATILSARLGQETAKLLDHAFAYSALSAAWHDEDGNNDEAARSLSVGRAVREVAQQISG